MLHLPTPSFSSTSSGKSAPDHLFVEKVDGDMFLMASGPFSCTDPWRSRERPTLRRLTTAALSVPAVVIETTGLPIRLPAQTRSWGILTFGW